MSVSHWRALGLLALLVVATCCLDLGRGDPINSLEAGYVLTVHEMVRDGDWLVPRLNDRPRLVKPPLPFWVAAGVCKVIHSDHAPITTLRAISAAVGLAAGFLVYLIGCELFDRRAALWAAAVYLTTYLIVHEIRYARHDIFLAAFVNLAMLGLVRAWLGRCLGWLIAGAGLILAFQVKGPVSWVMTVIPAMVYALVGPRIAANATATPPTQATTRTTTDPHQPPDRQTLRRRADWPARWRFIGMLLGLTLLSGLLLLPWLIASQSAIGQWHIEQLTWEAFTRVGSEMTEFDPPWFYLALVGFIAPWSVYLVAGLVVPFERKFAPRREGLLLAWAWLVVAVAVMSIPREKHSRYAVPFIAPAALLIGQIISYHIDLWRNGRQDPAARRLWLSHSVLVSAVSIVGPAMYVAQGWADTWKNPIVWVPAGLFIVLAYMVAYGFVNRRPWLGAVASVAFAAALLGASMIVFAAAPKNQEPYEQLGPKLTAAVGDAPVITWPHRPPNMLMYYADLEAPAVGEIYYVADHADLRFEQVPQLGEEGNTLRQLQRDALRDYLQKHRNQVVYVLTWQHGRDSLEAEAARLGFDHAAVMNLTTRKPRTVDRLRDPPLILIRLSP
jgi:4-amino-4-deoxy-L-arabinose transferase-like glycosyltransferase